MLYFLKIAAFVFLKVAAVIKQKDLIGILTEVFKQQISPQSNYYYILALIVVAQ